MQGGTPFMATADHGDLRASTTTELLSFAASSRGDPQLPA